MQFRNTQKSQDKLEMNFFLKFYLVYNGFYVELLLDHYYHS